MADLRVELYGHLVGHLVGDNPKTFTFRIDPSVFSTFELGSTVLSEAVPLNVSFSPSQIARARIYFEGLLPEGRVLTNLANRIRVDETDSVRLLAHYGRDVAGAVQIWDPEMSGEPRLPRISPISRSELEVLLSDMSRTPLGNTPGSGKTSLAGVQEKIVLALVDNQWNLVHDGYPSTHIVKPESRDVPTMIYDEEYGCRLARQIGLASHTTEIKNLTSIDALFVERYDRDLHMPDGRIHQEDMSQILAAHGSEKYEENGGKVSLQKVARVFSKNGDNESLRKLLQMNVLAVAIGNLDMHAKNISVLHFPDGRMTIAPAYDVVPLRHVANDGRMSMTVNNKLVHAEINADDLYSEADSWNLGFDPWPVIEETLQAIGNALNDAQPHKNAHKQLRENLMGFTANLLNHKPVGELQ